MSNKDKIMDAVLNPETKKLTGQTKSQTVRMKAKIPRKKIPRKHSDVTIEDFSKIQEAVEQGFFYEDLEPKELARYFVSQFEGAILLTKAKKSLSPIKDVILQGKKLLLKEEWAHLADGWMNVTGET